MHSGGDRGGSEEPTQAYSEVRRGERRSDNEGTRLKANRYKPKPEIRLNLWLETTDGQLFGMGRAQLLDKIEECGSLRKAAEEMCMSYRAAWGKIKKTEEILGFKLIEKERGNKTGYRLTEAARTLKKSYRDWYQAVETEALQKARELFPWAMTTRGVRTSVHRISKKAGHDR
jgi:molybdate transport system regulatory protein